MSSTNQNRKGPRPRISAKDPKFATVLVGPSEEKFIVHKELLTFYSNYFRAALTGPFKEAEERIVRLKDETTDTFELFVHWLYYQRFPQEEDNNDLYKMWAGESDNGEKTVENLIYLYVFCEMYDVPELKIMAITQIYNHIHDPFKECPLPARSTTEYVFDNVREDSPLCDFLVDAHCYWASGTVWVDFAEEDWPPTFIQRVLCQYTEFSHCKGEKDEFKHLCEYHGHKSDDERKSCRKEQEKVKQKG